MYMRLLLPHTHSLGCLWECMQAICSVLCFRIAVTKEPDIWYLLAMLLNDEDVYIYIYIYSTKAIRCGSKYMLLLHIVFTWHKFWCTFVTALVVKIAFNVDKIKPFSNKGIGTLNLLPLAIIGSFLGMLKSSVPGVLSVNLCKHIFTTKEVVWKVVIVHFWLKLSGSIFVLYI